MTNSNPLSYELDPAVSFQLEALEQRARASKAVADKDRMAFGAAFHALCHQMGLDPDEWSLVSPDLESARAGRLTHVSRLSAVHPRRIQWETMQAPKPITDLPDPDDSAFGEHGPEGHIPDKVETDGNSGSGD